MAWHMQRSVIQHLCSQLSTFQVLMTAWRLWLHIVIQHFCSQAPTSASLALCIGHLRHHINGISNSKFFIIDQLTFMFIETPSTRTNNNACICASYFCICPFFVSTFAFARSTFLLFQAGANKDERDVPEMQNSTMFWDSNYLEWKLQK